MFNRLITVGPFAILAAGFGSAATIIPVKYIDAYNTGTVQRDVGDGGGFITLTTGLLHFKLDPAGANTDYLAFCIEPRQFVNSSTQNYMTAPLSQGATNIGGMGAAKAELLKELFGRFYPTLNTPVSNLIGGALQVAVWEIVRETSGTLDVVNGTTRFQNPSIANMLTQAQSYLDALDGTGPKLQTLQALNHPDYQDIVFTPEPGTLGVLGAALMALGLYRRRR